MTNVKQSWNGMRDSLVSAADKIKDNVGNDISNLSSNIGTFYSKIRNPALFLGGMDVRTRSTNRLSVPKISGISGGLFAGHPTSQSKNQVRMLDMAEMIMCNDPNGCYAGWSDFRPNEPDIMNKVDNYIPTFPPYGSLNTDVGDFENSSFPIMGNFGAFQAIAENMIGKTSYQFYTNSKGGSLRSIYESGGFNCWDGANIMLQLASAFGLGGYMAHGAWNGIPHVWAVINGKTMDTTAYQDGYGWTSPKVSGYAGSPSIKNLGEMNPNYGEDNGPISIEFKNSLKQELTLHLTGIPDNMDQKALEEILKGMIKDPEILKSIVKDDNFMKQLNTEIARKIATYKRTKGAS